MEHARERRCEEQGCHGQGYGGSHGQGRQVPAGAGHEGEDDGEGDGADGADRCRDQPARREGHFLRQGLPQAGAGHRPEQGHEDRPVECEVHGPPL
ncbi:hypothetical protein [Arthrobacter agilis]|uniref:hypothetical protein n=1 Tax=Arthrobacter agilis TaxID=37921 RepID=UPI0027D8702D|nr:hypothetical protein [Arthrobacter agilis]